MDHKVIKAALEYIDKRITTATTKIVAAVSAIKLEKAELKVEKTVVDVTPVVKSLAAVEKAVKGIQIPAVDTKTAEQLLTLILNAIQANQPEKLAEKFDALDVVFKGLKPKDTVRFDDTQMKGLMAALTNGGLGGGGNKTATDWDVVAQTLTLAGTEYTYTFPANTVSWTMKLRGTTGNLYYASQTGVLPTSGNNSAYLTLPARGSRSQDNVEWSGKTIYFESDTAGAIVEIEVFTM